MFGTAAAYYLRQNHRNFELGGTRVEPSVSLSKKAIEKVISAVVLDAMVVIAFALVASFGNHGKPFARVILGKITLGAFAYIAAMVIGPLVVACGPFKVDFPKERLDQAFGVEEREV